MKITYPSQTTLKTKHSTFLVFYTKRKGEIGEDAVLCRSISKYWSIWTQRIEVSSITHLGTGPAKLVDPAALWRGCRQLPPVHSSRWPPAAADRSTAGVPAAGIQRVGRRGRRWHGGRTRWPPAQPPYCAGSGWWRTRSGPCRCCTHLHTRKA